MQQVINIKRACDHASPDDGYRIYVDRLWPRGLSTRHSITIFGTKI